MYKYVDLCSRKIVRDEKLIKNLEMLISLPFPWEWAKKAKKVYNYIINEQKAKRSQINQYFCELL